MKVLAISVSFLAYVSYNLHASTVASTACINESCSECYETLVNHVVKNDKNRFRLLKTFFPPNDHPPVFVIVMYDFENNSKNYTEPYFWTFRSSYFLQPLQVFQFTSLFLGTPAYLSGELTIILPDECENANPEHLEMLTYLVCSIYLLYGLIIFFFT